MFCLCDVVEGNVDDEDGEGFEFGKNWVCEEEVWYLKVLLYVVVVCVLFGLEEFLDY